MSRNTSTSEDDAKLRLSGPDRDRLKAVVFDANAYSAAKPDLGNLARIAERLAAIGKETWVPLPVAWEWAEHLATDWQKTKSAVREERLSLRRAGLEAPEPAYDSREAVIDAALAKIASTPHVKIIELTESSAIEALKDQILLRPPAKRKGETKTGAADSAWLRAVLEKLPPEELLIVSADRDVAAAFVAWNKPAPPIRTREKLRQSLFGVTVDDDHARLSVLRYLLGGLPVENLGTTNLDIGRTTGLAAAVTRRIERDGPDVQVLSPSVTRLVALAGLYDIVLERDVSTETPDGHDPAVAGRPGELGVAKHDIVYATAMFLAEGEAAVAWMLDDEEAQPEIVPYDNVLVRAQLSFHFTDAVITKVAAEADSVAMLAEQVYGDDDDGVTELAEALSCVPGLDLDEDVLRDPSTDEYGAIAGTGARIEVRTKRDGDTRVDLTFHQGDTYTDASVEFTYNPDSWWGGSRDGVQGSDAYQVTVDGRGLSHAHGVWAVPAWIIGQVDWTVSAEVESDE
ncbi:hypothetical protein [Kitasatospora sp. NPDC088346]|uniref:hypothetical protein n=1 Tax=Kitasatospora sp. NPDC088346 TaxID=3364073 RepID=UPI0038012034